MAKEWTSPPSNPTEWFLLGDTGGRQAFVNRRHIVSIYDDPSGDARIHMVFGPSFTVPMSARAVVDKLIEDTIPGS